MVVECPVEDCREVRQSTDETHTHVVEAHTSPLFERGLAGHTLTCYCDLCGDRFQRQFSAITTTQYCTQECAAIGNRKDEPDDYSPIYKEARADRLETDGFRCVDCGMPERVHSDLYGTGLHGHHIDRVDGFENPDDAHTIGNLRSLCRQCHRIRHLYEPDGL